MVILMNKCEHKKVRYETDYDPHKGYTKNTYCEDCEKPVYYYDGEYYGYDEER